MTHSIKESLKLYGNDAHINKGIEESCARMKTLKY